MVNYTRKAIGGAVTSYIFLCLTTIAAFLIRIVLARKLSIEEFGLFYAVLAFLLMFRFLRDLALSEAQVKFIPRFLYQGALGRIKGLVYFVLSVQTALGTVFLVGFVIAAPALALHYFKSPLAGDLLRVMALWFLLEGPFEAIFFAFNATMNIFYQSSAQFLQLLTVLGLSIFLLSRGIGVQAPAFAYVLSACLIFTIYFPLLHTKVFPWFSTTRIQLSAKHIREYLRYSLPLLPGTAAVDVLFSSLPLALLTWFTNLNQVALYAVALALSQLLRHVYQPILNVLFPLSSELWEKKRMQRLSRGIAMLYKYVLIIIVPLAGVLMAFPREFLGTFFGQDYVGASLALQILAPTMIIITYALIVEAVFMGIGKSNLSTKQIYVGGVLNLVLGILLIPKFGMGGAAVALFIASLGRGAYGMKHLRRFVEVPVPWLSWILTGLASIVFLAAILVLKLTLHLGVWVEMAICLSIAMVLYLGFIILTGVVKIDELSAMKERVFSGGDD